jgi:RNA polymerase sigma factor (sigma-70 family)
MADSDPQQAIGEALSQLFRDQNQALVGYLTTRLGSRHEAKEVAQEAYVRLLQMRDPGSPELLRAYLFKTATNIAIDRLRHGKVRQRLEQQPELLEDSCAVDGERDDPAKQVLAREQADQLLGFLQELPAKCQQVFNLHRLEEVAQHEVGRRLGFSERMVRRYITYAMVYCHLRLEGMTPDEARQKVSL